MLSLLKNSLFVISLIASLVIFALSTSIWAVNQTLRTAALSKAAVTQSLQHKKKIAGLSANVRKQAVRNAVLLKSIENQGAQSRKTITRLRADVKSQTKRNATLLKTMAMQKVQNQKQVARLKAKSRLKRVLAAVPFFGLGAAGYFEEADRREWMQENPGKTNADYACEIAMQTADVLDEVLDELPRDFKLPDWAIPKCDKAIGH